MDVKQKANNSIKLIVDQIDELRKVVLKADRQEYDEVAHERMKRWKKRTVRILSENVNPAESEILRKKSMGSFIMGLYYQNLCDEADMYIGFLQSLVEELEKYPEEILETTVKQKKIIEPKIPELPHNNNIFIIHGHDKYNLLQLKELLRERWKLNPIVLSSKPGKGRTIIEKFEQEAKNASYSLALFTPDDFVEINDDNYFQARPNAIFELGWFYGRLERSKVCILFKKGTKIHSDLDGISRIQFNDSIEEVIIEIENELLGAGILQK